MSGYDETNPEAYRPTEPEAAADSAHSGVDSWSASSQASPATAASGSEGASAIEDHGGYADLSQAYAADASQPKKGYVGIHSSGFRDFLLKPELLRAIQDCGLETRPNAWSNGPPKAS